MKKVCRGEYYFTATSEQSEVNGFFFNNVRPAPALFFCKSSPSDISHEYHFHAETLKWPHCVQIVFRLLYYGYGRAGVLTYGLPTIIFASLKNHPTVIWIHMIAFDFSL